MRLLGFAGLIPFIATALGAMFLSDLLLAVSVRGFLVYSAAILCFLAGTLWGETLPEPALGDRAPILISNGVVLFVVFATMTAQPLVAGLGRLHEAQFHAHCAGREPSRPDRVTGQIQ